MTQIDHDAAAVNFLMEALNSNSASILLLGLAMPGFLLGTI